MTALAVACLPDHGVIIVSDGAGYDDRGVVRSLKSKIEIYPEKLCVIGCRGLWMANVYLKLFLTPRNVPTFQELIDQLPDVARELHQHTVESFPKNPDFSFVVAGWSPERERFEAYSIASIDDTVDVFDGQGNKEETVAAFDLQPLSWLHMAPMPTGEAAARFGFVFPDQLRPPAAGETFDLAEYLIRCVCACRAEPQAATADGGKFCAVGGFLQVTILKRDSIETRIVHRWPDRVGELMDPTSGDALPAFLTRNGEKYAQTDQA